MSPKILELQHWIKISLQILVKTHIYHHHRRRHQRPTTTTTAKLYNLQLYLMARFTSHQIFVHLFLQPSPIHLATQIPVSQHPSYYCFLKLVTSTKLRLTNLVKTLTIITYRLHCEYNNEVKHSDNQHVVIYNFRINFRAAQLNNHLSLAQPRVSNQHQYTSLSPVLVNWWT